MRPVIEEIGGIASDRDELWQQMLRRQLTERDYWAQRAAEFGAAVGETWDTRALMDRFYQLPEHEWLCAATIELMTDAKAAGLRVGALTNDMTAFHGPELGGPPGAPEAVRRDRRRQPDRGDEAGSARLPRAARRRSACPRSRSCSSTTCRGTPKAPARRG